MNQLYVLVETLVVALVGVAIFSLLHIPLPWLIGSLVATAVWHVATQRHGFWPLNFRKVAMVILGYVIGTSFTKETLVAMGGHIPSMITVTLLTIVFSLLLGWLFSKITGLDATSCMVGSIPGGLSQIMVLLDDIKDLNTTIVMFLQSLRVMLIVVVVPILTVYLFGGSSNRDAVTENATGMTWMDMPVYAYALYPVLMIIGAWLFARLHIPTALLLGPLALTIVLTFTGFPTPDLPMGFVNVAQILIGVHIGLQMQPRDLPNWKRVTFYAFGTIVLLVAFGIGLGFGLTWLYNTSYITALLSTAPGGMVEMGLTAVAVGGDVSVVTTYQLFRLLIILICLPFSFKLLRGWLAKKARKRV